MGISIDDELPHQDQGYAEKTAPLAVSDLIRTREDALRIHRVIRGHVEVLDWGRSQCNRIGGILAEWDSPEFSKEHAEEILSEANDLEDICEKFNDLMELAAVRIPLYALVEAAARHAEETEKRTTSSPTIENEQ